MRSHPRRWASLLGPSGRRRNTSRAVTRSTSTGLRACAPEVSGALRAGFVVPALAGVEAPRRLKPVLRTTAGRLVFPLLPEIRPDMASSAPPATAPLRDRFGRAYEPAVGPRLRVLLALIFAAVAILGATAVYLSTIRGLEWLSSETYQNFF